MPEKKTLNEDLFYKGSSANLPRLHTCKNKVPLWDFKEFAVTQRAMEKGNIISWTHLKQGNLRAKWREECNHRVIKAEVLRDQTHCKIHRQQVNLWNWQMVSERPETTTQKTFTTIERWSSQVIQA